MTKTALSRADKLAAIFKAYDVRGKVPEELDEEIAFDIGKSYCEFLQPKNVVVGHDIRRSSAGISRALIAGLNAGGAEVIDIGLCGTEMVYYATFSLQLAGGIMVTASHNPANYNGMKMVRESAKPISSESGLVEIKAATLKQHAVNATAPARVRSQSILEPYVDFLLKVVDPVRFKPLKIVCNAGNGVAGPVIDAIEKRTPFRFIKMHHEPDGSFPNGVPNPLLPENRAETSAKVREMKADLGIAWDGDFDRCFFYDERGDFVDGYYMVGLLAQFFLQGQRGAKIVHDPRLMWDTIAVVREHHGIPMMHKSGHAFMKERMRKEDAVYGGETSAHHYFRSFGYCDSGMLPWLVVAQILSARGKKLSELVDERRARFPNSGEINRAVNAPHKAIEEIKKRYAKEASDINEIDGLSLEFAKWRFNLRMSNTEPLIRLNVETRGDRALLSAKTEELLRLIEEKGQG